MTLPNVHPSSSRIFCRTAAALGLLALLGTPLPASAQTLTFDTLSNEPGVNGSSLFVTANGGSRTLSGVTFDSAANSDWEIVGNQYQAPFSSDYFAESHSGDYVLAGNAFSGTDNLGNLYPGLTLSTTKSLTSLYVGFDDNGGGSNDADSLTITAYGASGDLASKTTALNGPTLSLLDTSSVFTSLSGVTGYRFETTASNPLDESFGQAYVIADDLTFGGSVIPPPPPPPPPSAPEPSSTATVGIMALFASGFLLRAARLRRRIAG